MLIVLSTFYDWQILAKRLHITAPGTENHARHGFPQKRSAHIQRFLASLHYPRNPFSLWGLQKYYKELPALLISSFSDFHKTTVGWKA